MGRRLIEGAIHELVGRQFLDDGLRLLLFLSLDSAFGLLLDSVEVWHEARLRFGSLVELGRVHATARATLLCRGAAGRVHLVLNELLVLLLAERHVWPFLRVAVLTDGALALVRLVRSGFVTRDTWLGNPHLA